MFLKQIFLGAKYRQIHKRLIDVKGSTSYMRASLAEGVLRKSVSKSKGSKLFRQRAT